MIRRLYLSLFAALLTTVAAAPDPAGWPEVRAETKPWSRWWWLGSIADPESLQLEMERYAAAGLGGLELTPVYGVKGEEQQFVPYLSVAWMNNLTVTLAECRRLGLGLDLANGTGWPFGGPWLGAADVAHHLAHRTFVVPAGAQLTESVACDEAPVLRFAGPERRPLSSLRQPVTANPDLQALAIDQVRFPGPLPLVTLVGFPERGEPVDLTSRVAADHHLDWRAPTDQGEWKLYALFLGQHGKMVERAAPGAEGYALDHLSQVALAHYLARFDAAFAGQDVSGIRAFFNDSYEVDDAQGEADFTNDFLAEFQHRRGYDLRRVLPDLLSRSEPRVLSDYRETVSDLLLDGFTRPWHEWAAAHGARIRNQSHGAPANLLDLYAASDIPEQEGSDVLATKLASSAAHLTGKRLTSAETGTWLNEHFLGTLAQLKTAVDTNFLGGVNHIVYHGTASSPPDQPWPGFQFYAAVELNPQNSIWHDLPVLNAYVARVQSWLQTGIPDEDVLLYYNIHDRWAEPGDGTLPHFNGGARDAVGARAIAERLRAAGLGFDYVSDRLLTGVQCAGGRLIAPGAGQATDKAPRQGSIGALRESDSTTRLRATSDGHGLPRYRAIVVPPTRFMPEATLARLVDLAAAGAHLVFVGGLPASPPGRHGDAAAFAKLLAALARDRVAAGGESRSVLGKGTVMIGPDPLAMLAHSGIIGERLHEQGVEWVRRKVGEATVYFLINRRPQAFDGWLPLKAGERFAVLFDPMTGQSGQASCRPGGGGATEVYVQLEAGASRLIVLQSAAPSTARWAYRQPAGASLSLEGTWSVRFDEGGPSLPPPVHVAKPGSWTEFAGEAGRVFAGTATYSLEFPRPAGASPDAWSLDLGTVCESARVRLNGREVGAVLMPPFRVVFAANELGEHNTLEIAVTNLAANRVADLDRRGVPWKHFYNVNFPALRRENTGPDGLFSAANWRVRPSGLLGPVRLTPLKRLKPSP